MQCTYRANPMRRARPSRFGSRHPLLLRGEGVLDMRLSGHDSLKARRTLTVGGKSYDYFSLAVASEKLGDVSRLPFSLSLIHI